LPGDRFYPNWEALLIAAVPVVAGLAFLILDIVFPPRVFARHKVIRPEPPPGTPVARSFWLIGLLTAAALTGTLCGIQFPIVAVVGEKLNLGEYSALASLAWLIIATLVVKMLDGLDGAASLLLLLTAGMVCYTTMQSIEYLLSTFSIILIGVVIGSIRFHMYPARLALRGGGSLFIGFLFAVLTVLARQKSITAGVVIIPVLLLALLLGGAMLGILERNLTLNRKGAQE
jgi:UDP-GlcNAc:undecaprenyl-phosphate GlcNAc-1-phosphate transferase